jgi:signal transduction histidine kinase
VVDVSADPISLECDRAAISRTLLILVDNAVKYTPAPGRISVALHQSPEGAVIEVIDTGIGISPDDLPHVFDRFYRADKARSRDSGGAGLGLSIAKWIIDEHKGRILISSKTGQGCHVRVVLPGVERSSHGSA